MPSHNVQDDEPPFARRHAYLSAASVSPAPSEMEPARCVRRHHKPVRYERQRLSRAGAQLASLFGGGDLGKSQPGGQVGVAMID
jgi:hypothetical protein